MKAIKIFEPFKNVEDNEVLYKNKTEEQTRDVE